MLIISKHHKTRAAARTSRVSLDKPVTWEEIEKDIDSLVGIPLVKEQLLEIAQVLENIRRHRDRHRLKDMPPLHFLVEGPAGGGKRRIAFILGKLLQYYRLADNPLHAITINNIESLPQVCDGTPIYAPVVPRLMPRESRPNYPAAVMFWAHLQVLAERQSVILGLDSDNTEGMEFLETLAFFSEIQLKIRIPEYSWPDYLTHARKYAAKQRFKLAKPALDQLKLCLEEPQEEPNFASMRSVETLIDRAIMNYYINPGEDAPQGRQFATLLPQHFAHCLRDQIQPLVVQTRDPLAEINSLVGLKEIKTRLNELFAWVNLQKRRAEKGFPSESISTHMAFSGSPGTGKTTVACLVGQALKEMGLLEKGHLVEVSREDLVGQYVGHTARKTADVIDRALGGVLFIDECYSLNAGHSLDFGQEAVAVLIKKMEDARDNLTVIFAGYSQEMESFLKINPGLRSRIQFHLSFPDYTGEELMEIFLKLCRDESYDLSDEAAADLERLLHQLYENKQDDFANGRLVRSLFERAKLSLAMRVWKEPETTSLSLILPEDIRALMSYDDVISLLKPNHRCIGFRAAG